MRLCTGERPVTCRSSDGKVRRVDVRRLTPYLLLTVLMLGTGLVGNSVASGRSFRAVSSKVLAGFNQEYREMAVPTASGTVQVRVEYAPQDRHPHISLSEAVDLVDRTCGSDGARIEGASAVELWLPLGASNSPLPQLAWAVSLDPPGQHRSISTASTGRPPPPPNWYLGFVGSQTGRPFCTSGYYAGLPRLPVFNS
jgi:hypothetical protein